MRLLIDGNIILDVLQNREPHVVDSAKIWKLCETDQAEGYVSALTFSNLVYIMRKELSPEKINEVFKSLGLIFQFTDLTVSDLTKAAEQQWDDFEDALQAATAERIHADNIITRNVKDFKQSKIVAFTPTEFLARL
jgi:predicted nucleic acid-binding protein